MSGGTERLIDGLLEDLEPVRPLPRLRTAFAVVLSTWTAVLGLVLWSQDSVPGATLVLVDRVYLVSFLGLIAASAGATLSSLAASRPGRERVETLGLLVTVAGLSVAALVCVIGILALGATAPSPPGADRMCFEKGAFLSLLPAGVILSFLVRGWSAHPIRAALVGMLAAGALGAVIVHLSCGVVAPSHLMKGHMSVPLALALVAAYPLGALLKRLRG